MKAKRRSSKSQPIRKRKKAKQVLARVAERKEIRQQKLERKLAEADARLNAARLASLSIPTGQSSQREDTQTSQQTPRQKGPLFKSSTAGNYYAHSDGDYDGTDDDDDDDDDDDIDCVEERQHAFSQLVGNLAKPLHSSSSSSKQNFTKSKKQSAKQQRKSNVSEISEHDIATEETNDNKGKPSATDKKLRGVESKLKQSDFVDILYKNVDTENRAAALRENEHFSHALRTTGDDPEKSVSVDSTYKTLGEWPRLRLLASASIGDKAEKNLRDLTTQEQQPVSLGTQLTTLRRWQTHPSFNLAITEQMRTPLVRGFAASMRAFHDVLVCAGVHPHIENTLRSLYVAHCVSHVLRCRARVLRNNAFVNEKQDGVDDENNDFDDDDDGDGDGAHKDSEKNHIVDEDALRDRGFVRARVLILVPMRNVAYDVVKQILLLAGGDLTPDDPDDDAKSSKEKTKKKKNGIQIINYERFEEEFCEDDEDDVEEEVDDDDMELDGGPSRVQNSKRYHGMQDMDETLRTKTTASKEHSRIFRGNVDDDFKLGISLSKKAIKLFTDFYESDFIIASPLGLRRSSAAKATGQDKHSRVMREKRKRDEDTEWKSGIDSQVERKYHNKDANDNGFLSSIEVCVIDGAHILSMQNWDTLQRTLAMVNNMPTCTRDTDFSRVRDYCLDGHMNRFRQTLVLSRYRKSDTMALFRQLANYSGKVQLVETPPEQGVMSCVAHPIRQTFFKVPLPSSTSSPSLPSIAPDERLRFFFAHTLPAVRALTEAQTLVIVPSYFDFVRVRNRLVELQQEDSALRFSSMCEYSRTRDVVRTRSMLFDRSLSLVVVTERFHFFWRHWIRGVNTIVWYGLPDNCQFYPELLNMTEEAADNDRTVQSLALYDQFDVFALERIVGPGRCRRMISKTARSTYMFV